MSPAACKAEGVADRKTHRASHGQLFPKRRVSRHCLITMSIPVARAMDSPEQESSYTILLTATGLTFGRISALLGLWHNIITQAQYSALVAAVVRSVVVPTLIANGFFLLHHLRTGDAGHGTLDN